MHNHSNILATSVAALITAVSMLSCSPAPADENSTESSAQPAQTQNPDPAHNSRISLDWAGRYSGNLPCADCEGIETILELRSDNTYTRRTKYTGKSREYEVEEGSFEFTDDGNYIELSSVDRTKSPFKYKVNEGVLVQLDLSGKIIDGDMASRYKLEKQAVQPTQTGGLTGRPWKLVELNGNPVKFNDSSRRPPYIIIGKDDNSLQGFGGCNTIFGQYQMRNEGGITFGRVGANAATCEHQKLESEFLKVLEQVDGYTLSENSLSLNRAKMAPLAKFEPFFAGR